MHILHEGKKEIHLFRNCVFMIVLFCLSVFTPSPAGSATMSDYCVIPPFVLGGGVLPNLLLTIDNSGSMYDLSYIDNGKFTKACSAHSGTVCTVDSDCPDFETNGETCSIISSFTRDPYYCYDESYSNANTYVGYFQNGECSLNVGTYCSDDSDCPDFNTEGETCDPGLFYSYNFTEQYFEAYGTVFPPGGCAKTIPQTLCINLDDPANKIFIASSNYLNWLTASKFDIEKEILTGGKYDTTTGELIAESRGCVGRRFVKEAITADFINYDDGAADPNAPLEITFGIRGPVNPYNPTALSQGGQSYIDIFLGDYNQLSCQEAIDAMVEAHDPASIRQAVSDCLSNLETPGKFCSDDPFRLVIPVCTRDRDCVLSDGICTAKACTAPASKLGQFCNNNADCNTSYGACVDVSQSVEVNTKVMFALSMQECWQYYSKGTEPGNDVVAADEGKCATIYRDFKICNGGDMDGKVCSVNADCPGVLNGCIKGPQAIRPGNPAYVCSETYAGYCAFSANNWATTNWVRREYATSNECFKKKYAEFCGQIDVPPVVDPTDAPSDTSEFENLPPIIADIGLSGQLGEPVETLNVKIKNPSEPKGLLQQYSDRIRFGAMSFNYNGSSTECIASDDPRTPLRCPLVCSSGPGPVKRCSISTDTVCTTEADCLLSNESCNIVTCTSNLDCPSGETCSATVKNMNNLDGASIIHYIGDTGKCSIDTSVLCDEDADCPDVLTGETCDMVGDHSEGLISTIGKITANSWTPFSEAFYNAIGYFARMNPHTKPPTFGESRIDLRLNAGDFAGNKNPSQYKCQSNNVLLISDGMSTADLNANVVNLVSMYNDGDGQIGPNIGSACPEYSGSRNLDDLSWLAWNRFITDFGFQKEDPLPKSDELYQFIKTFAVYSGSRSDDPGECNPETLFREAARNGGGLFANAETPGDLKNALSQILLSISEKAASGTAASVLASGEDEGANLLQAVFYPKRLFVAGEESDEVEWTGVLQNMWYYVDPLLAESTIREDSVQDSMLKLDDDLVAQFRFDVTTKKTVVDLCEQVDNIDKVCNIDSPHYVKTVDFEFMKSLWEAGKILWQRKISDTTPGFGNARPRNILTYPVGTDGKNKLPMAFSVLNRDTLRPYLNAEDDIEAENIIRYTHGEDLVVDINPNDGINDYRNRTVSINLNGDTGDTDFDDPGEGPYVWKLGDIVSSTPKVITFIPLNTYDQRYADLTYRDYFKQDAYQNRGLVFAGANDGMLHAFMLGSPKPQKNPKAEDKITLVNPTTGNPCSASDQVPCGEEVWAYIPKSVLPYLKYNAERNYCHLYYVDGAPFVFDASIGDRSIAGGGPDDPKSKDTWRTVLIGRLNFGTACRANNSPCTDCVKTPGVDLDEDGDVEGSETQFGISSYFAFDITDPDPDNWKLLWDFADERLGFTTTGPSIVRMNGIKDGKPNPSLNGDWFVVIPSGPTGPIDKPTKQFLGRSDQKLRFFVLDLRDGTLKATIEDFTDGAGAGPINYAFSGSVGGATFDPDLDYQDDALYYTYTNSDVGTGDTWTNGGIVRLLTVGADGNETRDPTQWKAGIVIKNVGAHVASVDHLHNTAKETLWLFFGTGRYYYKQGIKLDDSVTQRRLFGIKDPCFENGTFTAGCSSTVSFGSLSDVTTLPADGTQPPEDDEGWFIDLEAQNVPLEGYDAERVVTNPISTTLGAVYFTTFKPSSDICAYGGSSYLWAVQYNTGGEVVPPLTGKALIQVSTGSIEEIDLKSAFNEKEGRRTAAFTGKPPEGPGLIILTPPAPYARSMHYREK